MHLNKTYENSKLAGSFNGVSSVRCLVEAWLACEKIIFSVILNERVIYYDQMDVRNPKETPGKTL